MKWLLIHKALGLGTCQVQSGRVYTETNTSTGLMSHSTVKRHFLFSFKSYYYNLLLFPYVSSPIMLFHCLWHDGYQWWAVELSGCCCLLILRPYNSHSTYLLAVIVIDSRGRPQVASCKFRFNMGGLGMKLRTGQWTILLAYQECARIIQLTLAYRPTCDKEPWIL